MLSYELEHIVTFSGQGGGAPEFIGQVPEGIRINFRNQGGSFAGPRMRGKLRDFGGDWMTVRQDGIGPVDARVTFETEDGALILVQYSGIIDLGEQGFAAFLHGKLPERASIRMSPRFYASHPDYTWLNRLHCLGIGEFHQAARTASYDVYAVR